MLAVVEGWIGQEGDVGQRDTFLSILSHNYSSEANLILKIQLDKSFGRRKGNLWVLALFMIQLNPCLFGYWVCWVTAGLSKPRANPAVRSAESWRVSSRGNGSEPAVSVLPNQGDRDLSWSPFSTSLSKMQWGSWFPQGVLPEGAFSYNRGRCRLARPNPSQVCTVSTKQL